MIYFAIFMPQFPENNSLTFAKEISIVKVSRESNIMTSLSSTLFKRSATLELFTLHANFIDLMSASSSCVTISALAACPPLCGPRADEG